MYKAYNCQRAPAAPIGECMTCEVCQGAEATSTWSPDHWPKKRMCRHCLDAIIELLNWRERVGNKDFSLLTAEAEAILRKAEPQDVEHNGSDRR